MIRINVHDAKTHLSRYLARVKRGEVVIICNRNVPVAELRAIATSSTDVRPLGCAAVGVVINPAFFDPLPEELLRAFEGRTADTRS